MNHKEGETHLRLAFFAESQFTQKPAQISDRSDGRMSGSPLLLLRSNRRELSSEFHLSFL